MIWRRIRPNQRRHYAGWKLFVDVFLYTTCIFTQSQIAMLDYIFELANAYPTGNGNQISSLLTTAVPNANINLWA